MFDILGINKILVTLLKWGLKYWKVAMIAVVVICIATMVGCAEKPDVVTGAGSIDKTEVEDNKSQFALAAKSETDNSSTDNSQDNKKSEDNDQDNRIIVGGIDVPANQNPFPAVVVQQIPLKSQLQQETVSKSNTEERIDLIKAESDARVRVAQETSSRAIGLVEARAKEQELKILANAKLKEKEYEGEAKLAEAKIRAEQEKWRIIIWIAGVSVGAIVLVGLILVIIAFKAYLAQSPWDKDRKVKV